MPERIFPRDVGDAFHPDRKKRCESVGSRTEFPDVQTTENVYSGAVTK